MAITLTIPNQVGSLELGDYVDRIENQFDLLDQESLLSSGPLLKQLSQNRALMIQYINRHLQDVYDAERGNPYSVQSFVLETRPKFVVRANVWVKPRDYGAGLDWESRAFIYGAPHNHNFDFLTVGYFGSGYWTEIFELEADIEGYAGEPAQLKFLERTSLPQGKVMFFRKFKDVHIQLPPEDEISVSLNLMVTDVAVFKREQYEFDVELNRVVGAVNRAALAQRTMFTLARLIGDDQSLGLCQHVAERHANPRTRLLAWDAVAHLTGDPLGTWGRADGDSSIVVRTAARKQLSALESARSGLGALERIAGSPTHQITST
jgi:hypothetical protein